MCIFILRDCTIKSYTLYCVCIFIFIYMCVCVCVCVCVCACIIRCILFFWSFWVVHFTNSSYCQEWCYTLKKYGSLCAVMVLFRTIAFWRTLFCRNSSLLEFRVLCSRPFVFQICNCQSTSLLIFWSSVIQLHRSSTHSQQVNYLILKFKYKFNFKIVTGFQTNKFLSFCFCFWSHIAWVCAALLSFGKVSPYLD